tara:strand:+ start:112 stop:570 length:459 start_codon:yes stop_codon:yes gene_type:complete
MLQVRAQGTEAWFNPSRDIANMLPALVRKILNDGTLDADLGEYLKEAGIEDQDCKEMNKLAVRMALFVTKASEVDDFDTLIEGIKLKELDPKVRTAFMATIGWEVMRAFHFGIAELSPRDVTATTKPEKLKALVDEFEAKTEDMKLKELPGE